MHWVNCAAHIAWLTAFLYLFNVHGVPHLEFDTLSASMTALQVVLVIGGIFGFGYFRYIAERKAEEAAKEKAEEVAKPAARRAAEEWLAASEFDGKGVSEFVKAMGEEVKSADGS